MRILYMGSSKTIIRNLLELGVQQVIDLKEFEGTKLDIDGIVISKDLSPTEMDGLRGLKVPIVLSSGRREYQKNIDVLVLDEDEMNSFCGTNKWDIQQCKDRIRKLMVKYIVVSLGKEEVKKRIEGYRLPQLQVTEVKVTDREVERAKDVIVAIIAYIYIKEGVLGPGAVEKAKVGAISEVIEMQKGESFRLEFKLKRSKR
jgi:hypothetical protein